MIWIILIIIIIILYKNRSKKINYKDWGDADLYLENDIFVKKYNNQYGYLNEKQAYIELKPYNITPELLGYNDKTLELFIKKEGEVMKVTDNIPNLNRQIKYINNVLKDLCIVHNDIIADKILNVNGRIKLIDFEHCLWVKGKNCGKCVNLPDLNNDDNLTVFYYKLMDNDIKCDLQRNIPYFLIIKNMYNNIWMV